jgi:hypothetical protein
VGIAFALTATGGHPGAAAPRSAGPPASVAASLDRPLPAGCPPVQAAWPSLAQLPAGMRPGAFRVIIDAQFSGRCGVP